MMTKFSENEFQKCKMIVFDEYKALPDGESQIKEGMDLLVKLINCKVEGQVTEQTGSEIRACIEGFNGIISAIMENVEGVMSKIVAMRKEESIRLGSVPVDCRRGLAQRYCELNVMEGLDESYQNVRNNNSAILARDIERYEPLSNQKHKWVSEARPHQLAYFWVWKYRNVRLHGNELDSEKRTLLQKCYFTALFDICVQNKELIERYYFNGLCKAVDFVEVKKKLREGNDRTAFFRDVFTPLSWGDEEVIRWDNDSSRRILLIGEAGAGKSTQMEKLYWDELCSDSKTIPVWIQIQQLKWKEKNAEESISAENTEDKVLAENVEESLFAEIKKKLGKYDVLYTELLEQGLITLYLDGLNELLVADRGVSSTRLIVAIKELMANNPKLRICMTDRMNLKLRDLVTEYKCASMDEDACLEYCIKYWGETDAITIMDAVNPEAEKNKWFWSEVVTPEKINGLSKMVLEGNLPEDKKDYYFKYISHILYREEREKNDGRIPTLKDLLRYLAKTMAFAVDYQYEEDIVDLFKENLGNNLEVAHEYFALACQIPLLVEQIINDEKKYGFTYYGYYEYFKMKGKR